MIEINYLAVVVASIIAFLVGWLWYGPVFGKPWMKIMGMKKKDCDFNPGAMIVAFIANLVMFYVFAIVLQWANVITLLGAVGVAALVWLGFFATVCLNPVLWMKKPMKLFWLSSLEYLLTFVIAAIILFYWV